MGTGSVDDKDSIGLHPYLYGSAAMLLKNMAAEPFFINIV